MALGLKRFDAPVLGVPEWRSKKLVTLVAFEVTGHFYVEIFLAMKNSTYFLCISLIV